MTTPQPARHPGVKRDGLRTNLFSPLAWLLAISGLALGVWCIRVVPRLPLQPPGLPGVLFEIGGRRHMVYHGVAVDAPDGYALHSRRLASGQVSLVLSKTKLPWAWPYPNQLSFGLMFVQPDPALRLQIDSAECAAAHDRPCHIERPGHGEVTCFVRDSPAEGVLPARLSLDCLNARTAMEVRLFSPVAIVQPVQQALVGPISD
jgi:hypothetical protein